MLDLADPFSRHVEGAPDLVERARLLAVEAVAELKHRPFPRRKRAENRAQCLTTQRHFGGLVGELRSDVGEKVTELRLVVVTDRLLE